VTEHFAQYGGGDFAAASAAVRQFRESQGCFSHLFFSSSFSGLFIVSSHSAPFSARFEQLDEFDAIIDVRSPSEFAEDHIPGAINCPVLDDEERIRVGTLYKQVSPFEARKVGAALVSRNIANHIETHFLSKPKGWKPLVYCWRGGQRSGSMTVVLGQIGWAARRLEGGYKTFRARVLAELDALPAALTFKILCGPTGSAKTALLDRWPRRASRCWTWKGWPITVVRCWAANRTPASRARRLSKRSCGLFCAASTRRGRCGPSPKAGASDGCIRRACSSSVCAVASVCVSRRR